MNGYVCSPAYRLLLQALLCGCCWAVSTCAGIWVLRLDWLLLNRYDDHNPGLHMLLQSYAKPRWSVDFLLQARNLRLSSWTETCMNESCVVLLRYYYFPSALGFTHHRRLCLHVCLWSIGLIYERIFTTTGSLSTSSSKTYAPAKLPRRLHSTIAFSSSPSYQ